MASGLPKRVNQLKSDARKAKDSVDEKGEMKLVEQRKARVQKKINRSGLNPARGKKKAK